MISCAKSMFEAFDRMVSTQTEDMADEKLLPQNALKEEGGDDVL